MTLSEEERKEQKRAYDREYKRLHPVDREAKAAYDKVYREKNREKLNAQCRENWQRNRDQRHTYGKAYYQEHREESLAYCANWRKSRRKELAEKEREYYQANREHYLAFNREYYQTHKAAFKEKGRRWYKAHAERVSQRRAAKATEKSAYNRRYRELNPEIVAASKRLYRARKANAKAEPIDYEYIKRRDKMMCCICHKKVGDLKELSFDHLLPLARGGEHTQRNLAVAHRRCNSRKSYGFLPVQLLLME